MTFRTYCEGNEFKNIDFILRKVEKVPEIGGLSLQKDRAHDSLRVDFRRVPDELVDLLTPQKGRSTAKRVRQKYEYQQMPITACCQSVLLTFYSRDLVSHIFPNSRLGLLVLRVLLVEEAWTAMDRLDKFRLVVVVFRHWTLHE